MSMLVPKPDEKYSYGDYIQWPEGERWEIIDGHPYLMSPAPSREHQEISGEIFFQIKLYLKDKECRVYSAPFDVRLPQGEENDTDIMTVVQPDITVVCDRNKLDTRGCKGAPDLVVEILSTSSAKHDLNEKFNLYERVGVKEYWVVFPQDQTIVVYSLSPENVLVRIGLFAPPEHMKSALLPDFDLNLTTVFMSS